MRTQFPMILENEGSAWGGGGSSYTTTREKTENCSSAGKRYATTLIHTCKTGVGAPHHTKTDSRGNARLRARRTPHVRREEDGAPRTASCGLCQHRRR